MTIFTIIVITIIIIYCYYDHYYYDHYYYSYLLLYIYTHIMGKSPNYMVDFPAGIGLPDGIAEPTH